MTLLKIGTSVRVIGTDSTSVLDSPVESPTPTTTPSPPSGPQPSQGSIIEAFPPETFGNVVVVRNQPYGDAVDFIAIGSSVRVMDSALSWKRIETSGWIPEENLDCSNDGYCVISKDVPFRNQPNGDAVDFIRTGTGVIVLNSDSTWINIAISGWIPEENLDCSDEYCVIKK